MLTQIGVPFLTQIAPIDENALPGESPLAYVERLARSQGARRAGCTGRCRRMRWCWEPIQRWCSMDAFSASRRDRADALATLAVLCPDAATRYSRRWRLVSRERQASQVVTSQVTFRPLSSGGNRGLLGQRRGRRTKPAVMESRVWRRCLSVSCKAAIRRW